MALHESAAASNHPYTTHLNVLVPQLEMLDVPALVRAVSDQWYNQTLCLVDLEERTVTLAPWQGFAVPTGVIHRTRAPQRAIILMVENAGIVPTGD